MKETANLNFPFLSPSPLKVSLQMVVPSDKSISLDFPCLTSAKIQGWTSQRSWATWERWIPLFSSEAPSQSVVSFLCNSIKIWKPTCMILPIPLVTETHRLVEGCTRALTMKVGCQGTSWLDKKVPDIPPWASALPDGLIFERTTGVIAPIDPDGQGGLAQTMPFTSPVNRAIRWKRGPLYEPGRTMTSSCSREAVERAWSRGHGETCTVSVHGLYQTWLCKTTLLRDGDRILPNTIGVPRAPPLLNLTMKATFLENQSHNPAASSMSPVKSSFTNMVPTACLSLPR